LNHRALLFAYCATDSSWLNPPGRQSADSRVSAVGASAFLVVNLHCGSIVGAPLGAMRSLMRLLQPRRGRHGGNITRLEMLFYDVINNATIVLL
jgi:hypothetical protein